MLLTAIREATKPSHQALEGFLIPQLKKLSDTTRYADILRAFYGFIHPLEQQIEQHISLQAFPDYNDRRKSGSLLEDLKSIGTPTAGIPESIWLPQINNGAEAAGALYVLEGSTLGGQIIWRMLKDRLGEDISLNYFGGYGEQNGTMWGQFTGVLDNLTTDEKEIAASARAANETFTLFHQWLKNRLNEEHATYFNNYERTN